jgi:hypothetical protein
MSGTGRYVHFQFFKSSFKSWESLFEEAAAFAEGIGPERLIGISHSEDENSGVVTVWYWSDEPRPEQV